jgi:metal-responsive CopG/Arc/MetJ family transcriptional regulator
MGYYKEMDIMNMNKYGAIPKNADMETLRRMKFEEEYRNEIPSATERLEKKLHIARLNKRIIELSIEGQQKRIQELDEEIKQLEGLI